MVLVVVLEPSGDLIERGIGVGDRVDPDIVALEGLDEGLAHAVAFGAGGGREARDQVELGGEAACVDRGIRRAVIGQPFHLVRRAQAPEALFDGLQHPVADVGASDAGIGDGPPGDDLHALIIIRHKSMLRNITKPP